MPGIARVEGVPVDLPSHDEIAQALGRSLRARREEIGLSQTELGHRVGIDRVQIQNIEAGLSDRAKRTPGNPRLNVLIALCRELRGRVIIDVARPVQLTVEFDPLPDD